MEDNYRLREFENKTSNGIVDIDAVDHDGQTPLHYAALAEQRECYELLQKLGASTEIRNAEGKTAQDIVPVEWVVR